MNRPPGGNDEVSGASALAIYEQVLLQARVAASGEIGIGRLRVLFVSRGHVDLAGRFAAMARVRRAVAHRDIGLVGEVARALQGIAHNELHHGTGAVAGRGVQESMQRAEIPGLGRMREEHNNVLAEFDGQDDEARSTFV